MTENEWNGCYHPHKWDKFRTSEAMAHPAKMSNGLLERVFKYLMKQGLLKFGDTVLDPMAGIGSTALGWCSMDPSNRAITVELEEKFIKMQHENKALAEKILKRPLNWVILQGDARRLSELLKEKGLIGVTSPPYSEAISGHKSSIDDDKIVRKGGPNCQHKLQQEYGHSEGQIGSLPDRPATITSPPHGLGKGIGHGGGQFEKEVCPKKHIHREYADDNPDNIGNLPDRPVTITSPPYEDAMEFKADNYDKMITEARRRQKAGEMKGHHSTPEAGLRYIKKVKKGHPEDPDNIGKNQGESYLEAMSLVYQEIAKCCSVVVTVTKNPTRNKKLRRLDWDTAALLERSGFSIKAWIKTRLFKVVEQAKLDGTTEKIPIGRLSFFKRLSFKKGSPVSDHEDVLVAVKDEIPK